MHDTNNGIFYAFPPKDFLGLLVCYKACFSILETIEKVCVAICLNYKMIGLPIPSVSVDSDRRMIEVTLLSSSVDNDEVLALYLLQF